MSRQQTIVSLSLAVLWLLSAWVRSQTSSEGQDFIYTISTSTQWTDTGLDLQSGDLLQISASSAVSSACDPQGVSGAAQSALPLPTALAGALIARLHAQGASPLLIGSGKEIRVEEPSHLFLGVNTSGQPPCTGTFSVKVHRVKAGSNPRSEQVKTQLSTAAQIFMQGQFGQDKSAGNANASSGAVSGGSDSNGTGSGNASFPEKTTPAPVMKLSTAAIDRALSKDIDALPRRVNDQFQNLGDMVNFVIVGSLKSVQAALEAASWHAADTTKKKAILDAALETYENKDYLQMPMSTLYLFGRPQDFGYEMAEPIAMVASRHHFRIWKAPFTWNGQEVWVGAGTHDVGFAKDKRNGSVTHKIDPVVDGERDNIGGSLQKADKVKSLTYYLPSDPVQQAKNATGDGYQSDGRLLVIVLQ